MGKHSIKKDNSRRNAVAAAAVGMGAVLVLPATAQAVTIDVPNTDFSVEVPSEAVDFAGQYVDTEPFVAAAGQSSSPAGGIEEAVSSNSVGQQIADAALSKQGDPYVWGAAGPDSFDCSGLTSWAHEQAGKSIPRTSGEQAASGTQVSLDSLQPGDVVSYYSGASHVGIYIGGGQIVHALNAGSPVQIDDLNYMPINNAVRF